MTRSQPTSEIRIILADDHRLFRTGLQSLLARQPGIHIVGEADDGAAAVKQVAELKPDVVLMDISMSQLNGIEATRQIVTQTPETRVVILSMHTDRRFVIESLKAGARGYLLKDSAVEELLAAIRSVMSNQVYLSSRITNIVVEDYIQLAKDSAPTVFNLLSAREREVLQMVAEGKNTKEIAGLLNVSVKTIETHRKQVMDKLGLRNVAELTKYAIREGLTPLE
jgi:DNA-binding NarL/FixJ family response regulator